MLWINNHRKHSVTLKAHSRAPKANTGSSFDLSSNRKGIPLATIKYIPIQVSPGRKLKKQLAIGLVTCFSRAADAMLEAPVQPKHIKQTSAQQNHQQQI